MGDNGHGVTVQGVRVVVLAPLLLVIHANGLGVQTFVSVENIRRVWWEVQISGALNQKLVATKLYAAV